MNSKEYEFYLAAIDNESSPWRRRRALIHLSECGTEEALYYLNEIILDRYCVLPEWLKRIAQNRYIHLCLEFL